MSDVLFHLPQTMLMGLKKVDVSNKSILFTFERLHSKEWITWLSFA